MKDKEHRAKHTSKADRESIAEDDENEIELVELAAELLEKLTEIWRK